MEMPVRTDGCKHRNDQCCYASCMLAACTDDQLTAVLSASVVSSSSVTGNIFTDVMQPRLVALGNSQNVRCRNEHHSHKRSSGTIPGILTHIQQKEREVDDVIDRIARQERRERSAADLATYIQSHDEIIACRMDFTRDLHYDERYKDLLKYCIARAEDDTNPTPLFADSEAVERVLLEAAAQDEKYDDMRKQVVDATDVVIQKNPDDPHFHRLFGEWIRSAEIRYDDEKLTELFQNDLCSGSLSYSGRQNILLNFRYFQQEGVLCTKVKLDPARGRDELTFMEFFDKFTIDQRTYLVEKCARKGVWKAAGMILQLGVEDSQRRWAVAESSDKADENTFIKYFLPWCSDDQLDLVFSRLLSRGLWMAISEVLTRGVSRDFCGLALTQASARANEYALTILFRERNLSRCSREQMDILIKNIANRRKWRIFTGTVPQFLDERQCRWVLAGVIQDADDSVLKHVYTNFCRRHMKDMNQMDDIMNQLVKRTRWQFVSDMIQAGFCSEAVKRYALEQACREADEKDMTQHFHSHLDDEMLVAKLKELLSTGSWESVNVFFKRFMDHVLVLWAVGEADTFPALDDVEIVQEQMFSLLYNLTRANVRVSGQTLSDKLGWSKLICEIMLRSFLHLLDWESCRGVKITAKFHEDFARTDRELLEVYKELISHAVNDDVFKVEDSYQLRNVQDKLKEGRKKIETALKSKPVDSSFQLHHLRLFIQEYYKRRRTPDNDENLLVILSSLPVLPVVQNVALTTVLREKRWDVIRLADLSQVWEHVRRELFQAAVQQRQWSVVRQWANHALYDDQRVWALEEAFKQRQWDVFPALTEHGLSDDVLMRAHFRMAKYADWKTVLKLLTRGGDVTELRELLQMAGERRQTDLTKQAPETTKGRTTRLVKLEETLDESCESFERAVSKSRWRDVLYQIQNRPNEEHVCTAIEKASKKGTEELESLHRLLHLCNIQVATLPELIKQTEWRSELTASIHAQRERNVLLALDAAMKKGAWHVVTQIIKLALSEQQCCERLLEMVKRKKWAVVRAIVELENLLRQLHRLCNIQVATLSELIKQTEWRSELTASIQTQRERNTLLALDAAKKKGAWHVVAQIVKLTLSEQQRCEMLPEMVKRKKWDVVRAILETGVNTKTCLDALPGMIETRQWILVARVMEYSVDDTVRRQVLKTAMDAKEGSLAWHCIYLSQHTLSEDERNGLFKEALYHNVWQVIKPLVEYRDAVGIAHRDMALAEAIEQRQWDVVEHCQRYYADINQKSNKGETALHKAARNKEWKEVEELILRGADQFAPDNDNYTVLHRAAMAEKWDTVKLLVQFHGNLNQRDTNKCIPLKKVIDFDKADIIDESLFWGQDISRGVNRLRETPLHAVCAAGDWETMYYLVRRGVDPLAVTARGQSVLMYAVMNKECPQRMVAECIKLGFSTHQPAMTDTDSEILPSPWYSLCQQAWRSAITSPLLYAVVHGMPAVHYMLYESGSCSYKELFWITARMLTKAFNPQSDRDPWGTDRVGETAEEVCENFLAAVRYVGRITTNPRSLMSMCRLVISNSLSVRCRRPRAVAQLGLPNSMEDYVMFTDLTDPYGDKYNCDPPPRNQSHVTFA